MKVKKYLMDKIAQGTLHMALLDPDKLDPEDAAEIALLSKKAGSDAIMVGGSTGITEENLDATAIAIKKATGLPVILFPGGPHTLSKEFDAIYFMSMVNSRKLELVIGAQVMTSLKIKSMGVEPLSMGYIIVEPGMKVGEVGDAAAIPRDDLALAQSYALACEYLGMNFVYLEAGSGADKPVPESMIRAVKEVISVPLIVGGGIRTAEAAAAIREAGADIVVTGTLMEQTSDGSVLSAVIKAAKG